MKQARTTVSLPGDLMEVAQKHCDDEHLKFSNVVEMLIRAHLVSLGKLPANEVAAALRLVQELITARGVEAVKAKLAELSCETVLSEGAE